MYTSVSIADLIHFFTMKFSYVPDALSAVQYVLRQEKFCPNSVASSLPEVTLVPEFSYKQTVVWNWDVVNASMKQLVILSCASYMDVRTQYQEYKLIQDIHNNNNGGFLITKGICLDLLCLKSNSPATVTQEIYQHSLLISCTRVFLLDYSDTSPCFVSLVFVLANINIVQRVLF